MVKVRWVFILPVYVFILYCLQSHTAVIAYLNSEQLLPFGLASQYSIMFAHWAQCTLAACHITPMSRPRVVVSTAAFHARVRGSVPGLGGLKETKLFLPHPRVKVSIVGSLRDREVACSASDRQGSNFESCVWRTVSS